MVSIAAKIVCAETLRRGRHQSERDDGQGEEPASANGSKLWNANSMHCPWPTTFDSILKFLSLGNEKQDYPFPI
ncbi:hypothetical protein [Thiocystis violascens]|uniref:Uncharacterized protein n=1 Tax=Thiocystis violascens (strain ATCC 17096 / DSM 198 / 6111) TaxID=765911 RepID=I3Y8J0_THIV6|nr:hypothetical protein [Thiocystis violascens]AFL73308.1 hypothetical protein Thivi_1287 [Thiocystis violascens DSM 198]